MPAADQSTDPILETRAVSRHHGGAHALEGADFTLMPGEHVAVVGDNGAGKSTFVRNITGVEQPSGGTILFEGEEVHFASPLDARRRGIETVCQNLALADDLDVAANIFLGRVEDIIRALKRRGIPVIIISHNLRQVFSLVDRIYVFRRGRIVGCRQSKEKSANEIVSLITGVETKVPDSASYV